MAERGRRRRRLSFGGVLLLVLRLGVGAVAGAIGVQALRGREDLVGDLERWGAPSPSIASWVVVGALLVSAFLVVTGLATRLGALVLFLLAAAAMATAGRIDGGDYLVVPPGLAALCLLLLVAGGGAAQLIDRLDPR